MCVQCDQEETLGASSVEDNTRGCWILCACVGSECKMIKLQAIWMLSVMEWRTSFSKHFIFLPVSRWGLPRCFRNTGLYGKGNLEPHVSSLDEEFKCSKVTAVFQAKQGQWMRCEGGRELRREDSHAGSCKEMSLSTPSVHVQQT